MLEPRLEAPASQTRSLLDPPLRLPVSQISYFRQNVSYVITSPLFLKRTDDCRDHLGGKKRSTSECDDSEDCRTLRLILTNLEPDESASPSFPRPATVECPDDFLGGICRVFLAVGGGRSYVGSYQYSVASGNVSDEGVIVIQRGLPPSIFSEVLLGTRADEFDVVCRDKENEDLESRVLTVVEKSSSRHVLSVDLKRIDATQLPDEIWIAVFEFLQMHDLLFSVQRVCRRFAGVCSSRYVRRMLLEQLTGELINVDETTSYQEMFRSHLLKGGIPFRVFEQACLLDLPREEHSAISVCLDGDGQVLLDDPASGKTEAPAEDGTKTIPSPIETEGPSLPTWAKNAVGLTVLLLRASYPHFDLAAYDVAVVRRSVDTVRKSLDGVRVEFEVKHVIMYEKEDDSVPFAGHKMVGLQISATRSLGMTPLLSANPSLMFFDLEDVLFRSKIENCFDCSGQVARSGDRFVVMQKKDSASEKVTTTLQFSAKTGKMIASPIREVVPKTIVRKYCDPEPEYMTSCPAPEFFGSCFNPIRQDTHTFYPSKMFVRSYLKRTGREYEMTNESAASFPPTTKTLPPIEVVVWEVRS